MAYEFLPLIHRVHSAPCVSLIKMSGKQCSGGHCAPTSLPCVSDVAHWHLFTGLGFAARLISIFHTIAAVCCSGDISCRMSAAVLLFMS